MGKAIETTMMKYETTMMKETTEMMKETTMPVVETTTEDPTMDPTPSPIVATTTMMETTMKETTMEPTTADPSMMPTESPVDTTMMETTAEVIIPTEAYEMYGFLDETVGNKCQMGSDRAFKIGFTSVQGCVKRCYDDPNCKYATTEKSRHCIGCKVAPTDNANGWYAYQTYMRRRKLTAQEALRIENAALRAKLDELMRN